MGAAICAGVGIGIFADYSVAEKVEHGTIISNSETNKMCNCMRNCIGFLTKAMKVSKMFLENWEPLEETTRIINNI